jgi:hypothetical protein
MALDERTPLLPPLNAGENHVGRAMGQIEFDVEDRATALRKLDTWTPETLDEFIPQDLSYSDRTAFSLILLSRALCSDASRNCESSQSNTRSANLDALNKTLLLVTDLLAKYEANCVSDNQNVIDSFEKLLTTQFTGASDKSYRGRCSRGDGNIARADDLRRSARRSMPTSPLQDASPNQAHISRYLTPVE